MPTTKDLTIYKGKTFIQAVRWEASPFIYKNITAATQGAPVRLTVPNHGVPEGWRVRVESVKGMKELNDETWHQATVIDTNTIELNDVNSFDFKAYTSGGVIKYYTPVDMTGFTARMSIKDRVGGTEIASLTTANAGIAIDNAAKTITLTMTATASAAITAKKGVYDLEMVSASGVVTGLLSGTVTFESEVTT